VNRAAQTTGRNRPLTVVTSALMIFTMEAERWEPSRPVNHDTGIPKKTSVKVYKAEPGNGTPSNLVAEFHDVHAVYFSDDVELVKPEE
jgi:hypothetical protein